MSSSPLVKPLILAESNKPEFVKIARTLGLNAARYSFELRKNPDVELRRLRAWFKDVTTRFSDDAVDAFVTEWLRLTGSWTMEVLEAHQALQCRKTPLVRGRRRAGSGSRRSPLNV